MDRVVIVGFGWRLVPGECKGSNSGWRRARNLWDCLLPASWWVDGVKSGKFHSTHIPRLWLKVCKCQLILEVVSFDVIVVWLTWEPDLNFNFVFSVSIVWLVWSIYENWVLALVFCLNNNWDVWKLFKKYVQVMSQNGWVFFVQYVLMIESFVRV